MYQFKVSGMTCPSCARGIQNTLATIDPKGIVKVNIEKQLVNVSSERPLVQIQNLIEESGYPVQESRDLGKLAKVAN